VRTRDPVTTDPKGEVSCPAVQPQLYAAHNTPALTADEGTYGSRLALDPWFVSGLTEGEGCFCVSLAVRAKMRLGLEVRPSFALALNERDRDLLEDLRTYFGCGWIRKSKADRTFKYEARSVADLLEHVIPHFERFPLRGSKARAFAGFASVCRMIEQGDHLTRHGLLKIVSTAYEMNLGKRRHSQQDILRVLGEVKG
jgi:hypothetical protein